MSKSNGWTGYQVRKARAYWRAVLAASPLPCSHCGQPVTLEHRWDVDHLLPLAHGGDLLDRANQSPAHRVCNRRAGQAMSSTSSGS